MRRLLLFSVAAVLVFVVTPALAEPTIDNFLIVLVGQNDFDSGGGSGFSDVGAPGLGTDENWYYYDDWYNQWFYDAPPDPTRWKKITYDISIDPFPFTNVKVALNWSTLTYPPTGPDGPPPLPPGDEPYMHREEIIDEVSYDGEKVNIDGM